MRQIFIGDVHGMFPELVALLAAVKHTDKDHLIFVGDLLDKGPQSAEVVQLIRQLPGEKTLVEGNHEAKHRRLRKRIAREGITPQLNPAMLEINASLTPEDIAYLERSVPYYQTGKYLVVHAGIPGNMHSFPPPQKGMELLYYTRFIHKDTGKMIPLGQNAPEDPFWAEVYDGRFGHVLFGHQPYVKGPALFPHATGIDTGACFGGTLTAFVVNEDGTTEFVSVPGRAVAVMYGAEE